MEAFSFKTEISDRINSEKNKINIEIKDIKPTIISSVIHIKLMFKEIGIKRINDLLIERTDLFLVPTEILKEKLDKFNLNVLSELVNEDFCNLELIDMY